MTRAFDITSATLALDESVPPLDLAGGKGRSLAAMMQGGIPVPAGFVITTHVYRAIVDVNDLAAEILDIVGSESADAAALKIADRFESLVIPPEITEHILAARAGITGDEPVAVRSSATTEDLPGASFAGQHESFLNVATAESLLTAVRACWASLWTARAIAYRSDMSLDHANAAMAVVVQVMLEAEVSGVIFTANPTTGRRSEMVIEGSYGLGEAIVGGNVTPDVWLIDRAKNTIASTTRGSKADMVIPTAGGTTQTAVSEQERERLCLADETVLALADMATAAERLLGGEPQDVEWVVVGNQRALVQSRPITNLPTAPEDVVWLPPPGAKMLVRRQVVENMPGPLSPLFEDLYLGPGLDAGMDRLMLEMDMPIDLDAFITRPLFVTSNGYGYCRYDIQLGWDFVKQMPKLWYYSATRFPGILRSLVPRWQRGLADYQAEIIRWRDVDWGGASDKTLFEGIRSLAWADATYWFFTTMMVGTAKIAEGLLAWVLSARSLKGRLTTGMFLAGFDSRTLKGEQALEAIAGRIRANAALRDFFLAAPADEIVHSLGEVSGGEAVRADLQDYLEDYGHQVYDLDFAEPTQIEDPTPVLIGLKALVLSPRSSSARQVEIGVRQDELAETTRAVLGPLRRALFNKSLSWARQAGPYREEALFYMGAAWPTLRAIARELGGRLVGVGVLEHADDVYYLRVAELEALVDGQPTRSLELAAAIVERKNLREARKRLHPPGRVPEDMRFKYGPFDFTRLLEPFETQKRNLGNDARLTGFAVSPGVVTGPACLIRSVSDFDRMRPDSILVCPTTTPAWTPLFGQAIGLVTDIGAVLAHGSIVAREYGIPAVLGCGNATRRIQDGQMIKVDGSAGTVELEPPVT